jgi:hypothetical protein
MLLNKSVEKQAKIDFLHQKQDQRSRVGYFLPKMKRELVIRETKSSHFNLGFNPPPPMY